MVFSKILVPLEGGDVGATALTPALTMALATGASIELLTVVDPGADASVRDAAGTHLEYLAAGLVAKGVSTDTEVRAGVPAAEIVATVGRVGADLVAMATHGRAGLARAFLGSVAERVVATSPVPVLLVRPGGQGMTTLRTILVPVDGSPGGAIALSSALALARVSGARLVLIQVVVPILAYQTMDIAGYGGGIFFDPDWDEEALGAARRYVSGLAGRLGASGLRAEGVAVLGDVLSPSTSVVGAIVANADAVGADLIVMSTHAHTGAARVLLGSTADALVRTSHRPVMLVRRAATETKESATAAVDAPA